MFLMRDEKEERKKQARSMYMYIHVGQTNNKAKQHNTPKAVTFQRKVRWDSRQSAQPVHLNYCSCTRKKSMNHNSLIYMYKQLYSRHQKKVPVSVPFRSVHFRSNRLPRENSFSARHEFVCKIHCVRWRSIARTIFND